jgi:zinc D-Ala-D-Ala carboxypeptidase
MRLSEHFTLDELTVSETAERMGIDNDPPDDIIPNLRALAVALEMVREALGDRPVVVTSGYRSPVLNRIVGGSRESAHLQGYAADFTCPGFGSPLDVCRAVVAAGRIPYDQLIHEFGRWVHLSVDPRWRGQVLTIDRQGTRPGLVEVRR